MSVEDQSRSIGSADEAIVDTLELELGPDEMMALVRAAALRQEGATSSVAASPRTPASVALPSRAVNRISGQIAIAVTLAVADVSGVWNLSSVPNGPVPTTAAQIAQVHIGEAKASPLVSPAERLPVTFANPFDASEIFEFPAGTTQTEAHDAVADLLLQRARERRALIAGATHAPRPDVRTGRTITAQNSSLLHGITTTTSTSQVVMARPTAD